MTKSYYDISGQIDKAAVEITTDINKATKALNIPYFLVGAIARNIIDLIYGIRGGRLTEDIDFAINVSSWEEYNQLGNYLKSKHGYKQDNHRQHRFYNKKDMPVDIIPHGKIEDPKYSIRWPDTGFKMSTLGFEEVKEACLTVLIKTDPDLTIAIPTPASMAIMKLISWHEKYPERKKDATDILHILNKYSDFGNFERFYFDHSDIIEESDYDFDCGFARMLGRDIAKIIKPASRKAILEILEKELDEYSDYKLIRDMQTRLFLGNDEFDKIFELIKSLRKGLTEK